MTTDQSYSNGILLGCLFLSNILPLFFPTYRLSLALLNIFLVFFSGIGAYVAVWRLWKNSSRKKNLPASTPECPECHVYAGTFQVTSAKSGQSQPHERISQTGRIENPKPSSSRGKPPRCSQSRSTRRVRFVSALEGDEYVPSTTGEVLKTAAPQFLGPTA
ncbi:hypothetical protein CC80DRAFT_532065 [Byssothecium circinans]|uniref:Uncharacterized protein n=1 Tax=Byssothecium circinans TaxID=147558 RepID=A0A6A5U929_9PLEO|nr:hypothetical protein CC80DRAFT_532065 [Byssothecium circinans]